MNSAPFTPHQDGGVRWLVRPGSVPAQLAQILEHPDSFLLDPALLLADSPLITLGTIPPAAPGQPALLLRRLNYGRLRHRLRDVLRPTRAERAFGHGWALEQAGVATPRVLAAGARRRLRWPLRAYLLTEFIPQATTLRVCLAQGALPPRFLEKLAALLAGLHSNGFSHRDLQGLNIILDAQGQPWLIDLDGVRHYPQPNEAEAVANLARLACDCLPYPRLLRWQGARFLKLYCRARRRPDALRPLALEIARGVSKRLAQDPGFLDRLTEALSALGPHNSPGNTS